MSGVRASRTPKPDSASSQPDKVRARFQGEQNGFIERFNLDIAKRCSTCTLFQALNEVREQTEKWIKEYNEERSHDALADLTPREFY